MCESAFKQRQLHVHGGVFMHVCAHVQSLVPLGGGCGLGMCLGEREREMKFSKVRALTEGQG